jgi:hypothetical protein
MYMKRQTLLVSLCLALLVFCIGPEIFAQDANLQAVGALSSGLELQHPSTENGK